MMDLFDHGKEHDGSTRVSLAFITPGTNAVTYDVNTFKHESDAKGYVTGSVMHHILQCLDFIVSVEPKQSADKDTIIRGKKYLSEHMKDVPNFFITCYKMRHVLKAFALSVNDEHFDQVSYAVTTIIRNAYDYYDRVGSDNFFQDRKVFIPD